MSPGVLSPKGLQHHRYCIPDTEPFDVNGEPYFKDMKHSNMKATPERSPPLRQTRSTTNPLNNNAATNATTDTTTRTRITSSPSTSKRKAAAAALASINTNPPPPVISRKRKRPMKDQIEVQPARSRESSISTTSSSSSTRQSSPSMPHPSSISPPITSPIASKPNSKINRRNQTGETQLHRASAAGKLDDVRELIEQGAYINAQCNAGWTPLHKACLKGYVEIVRLLCANGAKTDIQSNDEHDTPLHDACSNGHKEVVDVLLSYGANPRIQNSEGLFPHEMVGDNLEDLKHTIVEATKTFKETKKESNDERENSEPPLSPATKRLSRRTSTASDIPPQQSLFGNGRPRRGAPAGRDDFLARDIQYRDPQRRGHLHLQALQGNGSFVRELLSIGAPASARDRDGNTPLHLAARGGHDEAVQALLEYGAEFNASNKQGETPLHEVAGRGHKEIVKALLFYGADPTLKDKSSRTALDVAIESTMAAEGEVDMLREKFIEFGGSLPPSHHDVDVKMEDDEITPIVKEEESEVTNDPTKLEDDVMSNGRTSASPHPSPSMEVSMSAVLPGVSKSVTPFTEDEDFQDAEESLGHRYETPTPSLMDGVQQEESHILSTTEEAAPEDQQAEEMQVDLPEPQKLPSPAPLQEDLSLTTKTDSVLPEAPDTKVDEIPPEESSEIPLKQEPEKAPSVDRELPSEAPEEKFARCPADQTLRLSQSSEDTRPETLEPMPEVPKIPEDSVEEKTTSDSHQSSLSPPEEPWTKLRSLNSLPTTLEKEISHLLPIYTMQFHNGTSEAQIYVAHTQICALLGFTSKGFFDRYPDISKRALLNREKSRFCTPFVSLVSHPLTRLSASQMETCVCDEILPTASPVENDLWHQFDKDRKHQFMVMSVYLVPLDRVREIIANDFPVLKDLVNRSFVRLDTSDLDGDEGVVNSDLEADRYIDCWRRVVGKYASFGL